MLPWSQVNDSTEWKTLTKDTVLLQIPPPPSTQISIFKFLTFWSCWHKKTTYSIYFFLVNAFNCIRRLHEEKMALFEHEHSTLHLLSKLDWSSFWNHSTSFQKKKQFEIATKVVKMNKTAKIAITMLQELIKLHI